MEGIYLFLVVILALLAVSDLIVGVSNDAVNFLNSAIGSKVAPIKVILFIATLGVLVGSTFSSGLMEVARKGIFNPQEFYFSEVMLIFVAVMITDVILLDIYNTFGLPTSTTVSLIFELLGAAVAISIFKISEVDTQSLADLGTYINSAKALAIISGILISIFIAFAVGSIVQYVSRIIFSFRYNKSLKYFGSLWGGLATSTIVYFILIKGAKGASFLSDEHIQWLYDNTWRILLVSFAGLTVLFQILHYLFKINILKVIVLVGTFSLAMSFAGNDLVNFIGVPMAGLASYQAYIKEGTDQVLMTALAEPVRVNTYLLLLAGFIMVISLWTSRKARAVTATEVNLGRQYEGYERFGSTGLSRSLVRLALSISQSTLKITPERLKRFVKKRFEDPRAFLHGVDPKNAPSFDLVRASVNLVVASALIALGTSLKLPLSTTYVTFMVAMATSLSDRAWGKDSAVYRVTGVFIVIGGWFLTALTAFIISGSFASILKVTGPIGTAVLVSLAVISVVRTQIIFRRRERKRIISEGVKTDTEIVTVVTLTQHCSSKAASVMEKVPLLLNDIITGLSENNLRGLRKVYQDVRNLKEEIVVERIAFPQRVENYPESSLEISSHYIQILDYLNEVGNCLTFIAKPCLEHVDNNHQEIMDIQKEELNNLVIDITEYYQAIIKQIKTKGTKDSEIIRNMENEITSQAFKLKRKQVKRIKSGESKVRNTMLYLNILEETRKMIIYSHSCAKSLVEMINAKS